MEVIMINIKNKQELSELLSANSLVLVDFWAEWCGPCKALAPILEKVSASVAGKAVVAKINVDVAADLAREYQVRGVPTLLTFKNAVLANRAVGLRSEADIVAELQKHY